MKLVGIITKFIGSHMKTHVEASMMTSTMMTSTMETIVMLQTEQKNE